MDYMMRPECVSDFKEVENLTREAFWNEYRPGCMEHMVIHKLRDSENFIKELDYVVLDDQKIIGSIVYSKCFIQSSDGQKREAITFGPISVSPEFQGRGIGKNLIEFTVNKAKHCGYSAIFITGNPDYYKKFGFKIAGKYNIYLKGMTKDDEAPFFMVKELKEGFLSSCTGYCFFDPCFEVSEEELELFDKSFTIKAKREPRETDLV